MFNFKKNALFSITYMWCCSKVATKLLSDAEPLLHYLYKKCIFHVKHATTTTKQVTDTTFWNSWRELIKTCLVNNNRRSKIWYSWTSLLQEYTFCVIYYNIIHRYIANGIHFMMDFNGQIFNAGPYLYFYKNLNKDVTFQGSSSKTGHCLKMFSLSKMNLIFI